MPLRENDEAPDGPLCHQAGTGGGPDRAGIALGRELQPRLAAVAFEKLPFHAAFRSGGAGSNGMTLALRKIMNTSTLRNIAIVAAADEEENVIVHIARRDPSRRPSSPRSAGRTLSGVFQAPEAMKAFLSEFSGMGAIRGS